MPKHHKSHSIVWKTNQSIVCHRIDAEKSHKNMSKKVQESSIIMHSNVSKVIVFHERSHYGMSKNKI